MNATPADDATLEQRDVLALTQYLTVLDDLPSVAGDEDRYVVVSESGGAYLVDLPAETCTCPDYRFRGNRCKHIRRVEFATGKREIPPDIDGIDPDIGRHLHDVVDEADSLADQFQPGAVVRDRREPNGRGSRMRVLRVLDARADEYEIWPGTTVAEYDPRSDPDDRVVEVVYEGDLDRFVPGWREWDAADLPSELRAYREEWSVGVRTYAYASGRIEVVDW